MQCIERYKLNDTQIQIKNNKFTSQVFQKGPIFQLHHYRSRFLVHEYTNHIHIHFQAILHKNFLFGIINFSYLQGICRTSYVKSYKYQKICTKPPQMTNLQRLYLIRQLAVNAETNKTRIKELHVLSLTCLQIKNIG